MTFAAALYEVWQHERNLKDKKTEIKNEEKGEVKL